MVNKDNVVTRTSISFVLETLTSNKSSTIILLIEPSLEEFEFND